MPRTLRWRDGRSILPWDDQDLVRKPLLPLDRSCHAKIIDNDRIAAWNALLTASWSSGKTASLRLAGLTAGAAAMRLRYATWKRCIQTGLRSPYKKLKMLKLADSERQEISAAFEEAEKAVADASKAMDKLMQTLEQKAACISTKKVDHLRNLSVPVGANCFGLQCQRYKIQEMMKLNRVFE